MKEDITSATEFFQDLKVLGVGGSPRANGNTDMLMRHILKGVKEKGISCHSVHLRNYYFQPCIGCEKCRKDKACSGLHDGMQIIYPHILASQGLVLISPTHNYNVTAWMKAFIDRLYCFYDFNNNRPRGWSSRLADQKRKAVIAVVCEQIDKHDMGFTMEAMQRPLEALGYEIAGTLPVFGVFDKGMVKEREDVLSAAEKLGKDLAQSLKQ